MAKELTDGKTQLMQIINKQEREKVTYLIIILAVGI